MVCTANTSDEYYNLLLLDAEIVCGTLQNIAHAYVGSETIEKKSISCVNRNEHGKAKAFNSYILLFRRNERFVL